MNVQWEERFRSWAQSPSQTETERCENAVRMVKAAIEQSDVLKRRTIRVFSQGSYKNRTNVRRESDVDVGVLCTDTFFHDALPTGSTRQSLGISDATYPYDQFKNEVGSALIAYFGRGAVSRGNKAFDIKATSHHVEADVAPFFEHRRYAAANMHPLLGVELRPDNGNPTSVINWPEQHYENGNRKNTATSRSYRGLVRVLKTLCNTMSDGGIAATRPITGFLNECLVWNVPDNLFTHATYYDDLRAALVHLYEGTAENGAWAEWGEVSELKYLFRGPQKWTRQQARDFVVAAWNYIGFS